MTTRLALTTLLLSLLLAACGQQDAAAPAADSAPATAAVEATPAETVADEPAADPAAVPATDADAAVPADAPVAAGTDAAPAAPAAAPSAVPGLVRGKDYEIIEGGQPYAAGNGIEVAEIFAYWCIHCAQLDPLITPWKARLPADVRFSNVPAVFDPRDNFARAALAIEAMGVFDKVHAPLFRAIHVDRSLRQNASIDDIAAFLAKHGVSADQARSTMNSFTVNANLGRARQFAMRSGVTATPTIIINGRYRVIGTSHEEQLQIADRLIAHERAASAQ